VTVRAKILAVLWVPSNKVHHRVLHLISFTNLERKKESGTFKHSELIKKNTSKKLSFLKELCSKSAKCSRTLPKTGLSVTNFLVYGAVDRLSAHELSHD